MRDSYFFVLESYTTLGGGNVALPPSSGGSSGR